MQATRAPARWEPAPLLEALLRGALDPRVLIPSGYLLLVRLDDFSRELALGLRAPKARPAAPREVKPTLGLLGPLSGPVPPDPGPDQPAVASEVTREIPPYLLEAPCYLVSIPGGAAAARTVTVGRAPTCDIVLQHPSVSAVHAHLVTGPALLLRDAQSRNQTSVNDEALQGSRRLQDGDLVKFGAVLARVCEVNALIRALQALP
jgi:hypothetical protein